MKAIVENLRGSVEKLSPKESVKVADAVLRASLRAHKGFSEGLPMENPQGALTLPRSKVSANLVMCELKVCKNCCLSPVMCGQLNLTLLPIAVGSLAFPPSQVYPCVQIRKRR